MKNHLLNHLVVCCNQNLGTICQNFEQKNSWVM